MAEWNPRANELFLRAVDLPDPAARRDLLDRECGPDAALRRAVETLLAAHAAAGDFLADPHPAAFQPSPLGGEGGDRRSPGEGNETHDLPPGFARTGPGGEPTADYPGRDERVGTIIGGKYKLIEEIGEGGMGTVWMAQQTEPVRRLVAVKLIKPGMDSRAVLARFEAERQALAMMDHPHIARVFDAGATADGRPYFVMELVKGVPITQFCDARKLTLRQRLELFVPVCQAVQHAHQKGVIHRDLKPSNVLVALYDDRPVPKVIDFGVAKAAGQTLTDKTLMTGFGAVVGTPEYMSPEQASLNNLDIDTRSDVYALGVLLYELLTGSTPVDRKSLGKAALLEVLRIVREVEAPRPSAKLSTLDTLPSVAANRGTEPAKLSRLMRGELDWVVLKALEKDRTRRYDTANGLARDIQRYLADEVVEARPPSTRYRLRKFVRRHKGQVIAAGLVLLALLAGIAGTTAGLIEARKQERLAVDAQRSEAERAEGERLAKLDAQEKERQAVAAADKERQATALTAARLKQIEMINATVFDIFAGFDIRTVKEGTDPIEAVLARKLIGAGKKLDAEAVHDPLVLAGLRDRLGHTLLNLGEAPAAIDLLTAAVEARMAGLGADHPHTLTSMGNLAFGYQDAGRLDEALPLYEETLGLMKGKLGADHPHTLTSMNNLALGYQAAGRLDEALPLLEETLRLRKAKLGAGHPDTLQSMNNLAAGYRAADRLDKALPLYEETLGLMKAKLGAGHPETLVSMGNLALGYRAAGRLDKALPLYEETLGLMKAKLGADHPHTLTSMGRLALGYQAAGKLNKALPLYEETLGLRKAKFGADHPDTLASMGSLAAGYRAAGRLDKALPLLEETLRLRKAKLGADHPDTLTGMNNLAAGYQAAGRLDKALPLYEQAAAGVEKRGFRHVGAGSIVPNAVAAYEAAGQPDRAEGWRRKWLAVVKGRAGAESADYAGELARLGLLLLQQRKWADAESVLRECLAIREKSQPDAWNTFNTQSKLGAALLGQGKYADAGPLLVAGYDGMKAREKMITPGGRGRLPEAADQLIELYERLGKPDELKKWRAERAKYPFVAPPPRPAVK